MNHTQDEIPSGPHDGRHLGDESLSAYMDGRTHDAAAEIRWSEESVREHLQGCVTCRARLGAMRGARALVGTPVSTVSSQQRATTVDAALEALEAPLDTDRVSHVRPGSWYRSTQAMVSAAAVLVALAVALPLVLTGRHSGAVNSAEATKHLPQVSAGVPDLGPVHSTSQVLSRLGEVANSSSASSSASPVSQAPAAAFGLHSGSSARASPGQISSGQISSGQTSLAPAVPSAGSGSAAPSANTSVSGSDRADYDARYERCITKTRDALHAAAGGPGVVAIATYRGQDALVLELSFEKRDSTAHRSELAVVSEDGCKLLSKSFV